VAPVAYYLHHEIKEKYLVHSDVMFLCTEKAVTSIKSAYFSKTRYNTKFQNRTTCGAEVAFSSNIHKAATFI